MVLRGEMSKSCSSAQGFIIASALTWEMKVHSASGQEATPYLCCHGVGSIDLVSCRCSLYGS